MAVFRVEKTKDFTIMSNHHLRNTELSLKAKGLLSLIHEKSSLAPPGQSLAFSLGDEKGFEWIGANISSVFRKRHRRRNRQHKRKRVWIANRRKHPSWNLLRMNCRRRQRIKSSPMQDGRRNGLHKKQSRHKIVCRPGRNCAWRRFPTRRPEKPKNT